MLIPILLIRIRILMNTLTYPESVPIVIPIQILLIPILIPILILITIVMFHRSQPTVMLILI